MGSRGEVGDVAAEAEAAGLLPSLLQPGWVLHGARRCGVESWQGGAALRLLRVSALALQSCSGLRAMCGGVGPSGVSLCLGIRVLFYQRVHMCVCTQLGMSVNVQVPLGVPRVCTCGGCHREGTPVCACIS